MSPDAEPYVTPTWFGYVLTWSVPLRLLQRNDEHVLVTRAHTTHALWCHACRVPGSTPCDHIRVVVAHVHRKKGAA